jgi:hypothetical protein
MGFGGGALGLLRFLFVWSRARFGKRALLGRKTEKMRALASEGIAFACLQDAGATAFGEEVRRRSDFFVFF